MVLWDFPCPDNKNVIMRKNFLEKSMIENLTAVKRNALIKKGLDTDYKVRRYFPTKYIDYRTPGILTRDVHGDDGVKTAIIGDIQSITPKMKNGKEIVTVKCVEQGTGTPFNVTLMHIWNAANKIAVCYGAPVVFMGTFKYSPIFGFSTFNPIWSSDIEGSLRIHTHYPKIEKVADYTWQEELKTALEEGEEETIPENLRPGYCEINEALRKIHYPVDENDINEGKKRIILDDLVYLNSELNKMRAEGTSSGFVLEKRDKVDETVRSLPYSLTNGQRNTVDTLISEASAGKKINALVEGDVGCGKTIVAFLLMICAVENGYQSVVMAPTQILAGQHLEGLSELVGRENIAYFDASLTKKQKLELAKKVKSGELRYVIGTHSLLTDIEYENLALAIVDEEHRFGVEQKNTLFSSGLHTVMLSATPIPRSCAQALYGDMTEVYQITDKPTGRKETLTYYDNGSRVKNFIWYQVKQGQQVYVVCPMIEESEDDENLLVSAEQLFAEYNRDYGSLGMSVGLVTGRMKAEEKDHAINDFKDGKTDILISTTVIEVGVNVPNANTIVIMNCERFGLSTLHQLRGRVGRGNSQGYCILVSDSRNPRIEVMCRTNNGFEIAEEDLKQRGPGNILGLEQSGANKYLSEMIAFPYINEDAKRIASQIGEGNG